MAGLTRLWSSVGCVFSRPGLAKLVHSCRARNFTKSSTNRNINLGETHKPTNFHKRILVWAKTYKTVDEVPDRVSTAQLKRAMDLFRIRVNFSMVVATVIGCGIAIMMGRRLKESGETLDSQGTQQREQWKRTGDQERAAKTEASSSN